MNRTKLAVLALALLLSSCRHTRPLDADEQAIVDSSRDLEAAAEMLAILRAAREMNFTNEQKAE